MNAFVVLYVEDELEDRVLVSAAFRRAAPHVTLHVVEDGEQAEAYLAGTGRYADRATYPVPHLVLLDLKLPRKSGFEVLGWIRRQGAVAHLPVIVLTSSPESPDVDRAYALGATSYLVKSVDVMRMREIAAGIGEYAALASRGSRQPA